MEGKVKFYNDKKGYGFIAGEDGKDYFFHVSAVQANKPLNDGQAVQFEPTQNDKGNQAINVETI